MQKITTDKFTYQNSNLSPEKLVPNQTKKLKNKPIKAAKIQN
ncbi:hypothetical protein [Mesomycoplasma ovipneumoniae]|nr:hypothetical protein [Mesomycoplasma ovipneumoniae]WNM13782.1 hypothetical protein RNL84_01735 [Mesomycoplasma ovipneumoniae]